MRERSALRADDTDTDDERDDARRDGRDDTERWAHTDEICDECCDSFCCDPGITAPAGLLLLMLLLPTWRWLAAASDATRVPTTPIRTVSAPDRVDVVYMWVNGSDPIHDDALLRSLDEWNIFLTESDRKMLAMRGLTTTPLAS